jgi:hypothetical protein
VLAIRKLYFPAPKQKALRHVEDMLIVNKGQLVCKDKDDLGSSAQLRLKLKFII